VTEKTGFKIAILGAGPAGLQAAQYLVERGYEVHVYDRLPEPGGMMMFAIPSRRIPKDRIRGRVRELERKGVQFILKTKIQDGYSKIEGDDLVENIVSIREIISKYDSILICTGAWKSRMLNIEGENSVGVYPALEYILNIRLKELGYVDREPDVGNRVVVIGAGRTAVDVVEELCLRNREVILIYRRKISESRAYREFLKLLNKYNIKVLEERQPLKILVNRGRVSGLEFCKVKREGDKFILDTSNIETIECDTVIEAIGEIPTPPINENIAKELGIEIRDGRIVVDSEYRTGNEKIFAAGDVVLGPSSIGQAVGSGLKAAQSIDKYLRAKR